MDTLNNAEKPSPGQGSASNSALTNANNNAVQRVADRSDKRHVPVPSSLPIVAALAFPPGPGLKLALLVVEECPACGWWHRHHVSWPAAKLLPKRGKCGQLYQLVPYVRRARRKAA